MFPGQPGLHKETVSKSTKEKITKVLKYLMFMIVDSDNWVKQNRKQAIQSDAGSCRVGASEVSAWCDRVSLSSLRSYHCQRENWTRPLSPRGMHWLCAYLWFWHVTWQHGLTIQTLLPSLLKWLKEGWRLVTRRQYKTEVWSSLSCAKFGRIPG